MNSSSTHPFEFVVVDHFKPLDEYLATQTDDVDGLHIWIDDGATRYVVAKLDRRELVNMQAEYARLRAMALSSDVCEGAAKMFDQSPEEVFEANRASGIMRAVAMSDSDWDKDVMLAAFGFANTVRCAMPNPMPWASIRAVRLCHTWDGNDVVETCDFVPLTEIIGDGQHRARAITGYIRFQQDRMM